MAPMCGLLKLAAAATVVSALLSTTANAQSAPAMASYCHAGMATYPDGIQGLPSIFKYNLCWWLQDADIAPAEFDAVLAATPRPGNHSELVARFRIQGEMHASAAKQLDTGRLAPRSEAAGAAAREWRKAAFYWKLTRRPRQPPLDDLHATERAMRLMGAAPERMDISLDGKPFVAYFQPSASHESRAPLVIVFGGLDNFKTEMSRHVAAMRGRGFATLVLENPDTGENALSFRPDAWRMLNAARNALSSRTDVDLSRVGVYGWSMGGYLATLGGLQADWITAVVNVAGPVEASFTDAHCQRVPSAIAMAYAVFANLPPTAARDTVCAHYATYALSKAMVIGPTARSKPILMINGALEDLTAADEPASLRSLGLSVTELTYSQDGHTAENNMPDHLRMAADWLWSRVAGANGHPRTH
jgi:hypothetical protein